MATASSFLLESAATGCVHTAAVTCAGSKRLCSPRRGCWQDLKLSGDLLVSWKSEYLNTTGGLSKGAVGCPGVNKVALKRGRSAISAAVKERSAADERRKEAEVEIAEMIEAVSAPSEDLRRSIDDTRTVSLTIHGTLDDEALLRLEERLLELDGVQGVWVGSPKQGGLRGGSVTVQLEVEWRVSLTEIVNGVHKAEEDFLALPFKSHSWMWRGHKLSYAVAGCGKPIILVHGFGGNAGHFRNLIAHLADHHRVYSVDLLGFGDSDKPRDAPYGPDLWADIILDFAKEFAEEPAVLIGNSIGSLTAMNAAAKAEPGCFSSLVLLNVAGGMNRKGLLQEGALLAALSPIFIVIENLLRDPRVANFLFDKFRSKANVRKILQQQVYRDRNAVTDHLVDILYEPSNHPGAVDVFVKVFTGEPGPRPEVLMKKIDLPMLVLWGDRDPWTSVNGRLARYFKKMELEGANVSVVPLKDVGHCPHDDRPELAAAHILEWLRP